MPKLSDIVIDPTRFQRKGLRPWHDSKVVFSPPLPSSENKSSSATTITEQSEHGTDRSSQIKKNKTLKEEALSTSSLDTLQNAIINEKAPSIKMDDKEMTKARRTDDERVTEDLLLSDDKRMTKEGQTDDERMTEASSIDDKDVTNGSPSDDKRVTEPTPSGDKEMAKEGQTDDKRMSEAITIDDKDVTNGAPSDDKRVTEPTPSGDKEMTKEGQTDDKRMSEAITIDDKDVTNGAPSNDKRVTEPTPSGDKEMTKEGQTDDKRMSASEKSYKKPKKLTTREDESIKNIKFEEDKQGLKASLRGLQERCVVEILKFNETGDILQLKVLANKLGISLNSIKKTIGRLKQKGVIKSAETNTGRGGGVRYRVAPNIQYKMKKEFSSYNSNNTIITTTEKKDDKEEVGSFPSEWLNIDITPLRHIGFSETHIKLLYETKKTTPEIVQESINHFAWGIINNAGNYKKYSNLLNPLLGILKQGRVWVESGYEPPQQAALRELIEMQRIQNEHQEKLINDLMEITFPQWKITLNSEQVNQIVPQDGRNSSYSSDILLKSYFKREVLLPKLLAEGKIKNFLIAEEGDAVSRPRKKI